MDHMEQEDDAKHLQLKCNSNELLQKDDAHQDCFERYRKTLSGATSFNVLRLVISLSICLKDCLFS